MTSLQIKRIFHPVGQGAFYLERHLVNGEPFNIVYDCGNRGCMSKVRPVVQDAFGDGDYIDIMFISHFDADHVSLISDLEPYKKGQIKRVVLPLLHSNVRYALAGYYLSIVDRRTKVDLKSQVKLILDPRNFFKDAEIVFVRPDEEFIAVDDGEIGEAQDLDGTVRWPQEEIDGARRSRENILEGRNDWALIPFNYNSSNLFIPLLRELIGWLQLQHAGLEDLSKIEFVNANRRALKSIYSRLGMGINENSMILYSGPLENCRNLLNVTVEHPRCGMIKCARVGCIYTGDANLNLVDLSRVYNSYMKQVGTIQISHHGSGKSFCLGHFPAGARYCPVSYGTTNTYGHPDKSIESQISSLGGVYVPITEKRRTKLTEVGYV